MLVYLNVDFEDKAYQQGDAPDYTCDQWEQDKHSLGLAFPNLPYYIDEENDVHLTETLAILKYIAHRYKPQLLGETVED